MVSLKKEIRDRISSDTLCPLLRPNSIFPEKMSLYVWRMWWMGADTQGPTSQSENIYGLDVS